MTVHSFISTFGLLGALVVYYFFGMTASWFFMVAVMLFLGLAPER